VTEAPFDDEHWYRFGRSQNLDKQDIKKLIVAQTVPSLRVCFEYTATMYLNNVRVNGIIAAKDVDPWFLLGVLNAPVADFVFRRIAKVKAGGFYEANNYSNWAKAVRGSVTCFAVRRDTHGMSPPGTNAEC
jgi:hypothetical protein